MSESECNKEFFYFYGIFFNKKIFLLLVLWIKNASEASVFINFLIKKNLFLKNRLDFSLNISKLWLIKNEVVFEKDYKNSYLNVSS